MEQFIKHINQGTRTCFVKLLRYLLLFGWAVCCFAPLAAQKNVKFTHLTNLDGLSQSTVQAILKDKYGFMWFGTQDGLNRYDGYSFKVYRHQPNESGSLPKSHITSLYEDRQGNLWVGTANGGLSLYDRKLDRFVRFGQNTSESPLSQQTVTAIYEDHQHNFWVGTYWKLNLLDRKTGTITQFANDPADAASISNDGITAMYEDSKNNLWVGTTNGLNVLDRTSKKFKHYYHDNNNPGSLCNNKIRAIKEDNSGRLWIGTIDGLSLFNRANGSFISYQKNENDPASISSNQVTTIENAEDGNIWIATNAALDLLSPLTGKFTHFQSDPYEATTLNRNANIMAMLRDKTGILWVGTYQGGINKYDKHLSYFDVVKNNPVDLNSLSLNIVTSFAEKPGGDIWVGTGGGALNLWKPASNEFTRYNPDPANANSPASWRVLCLAQSKKNDYLWIGMYGKCVDRYDPENNTFKHYTKGNAATQLNNDAVYALMEDRKGNIWMGTNGGGVNVLNPATGIITKFVADPNNPGAVAGNYVRSFYEDKNGNTWIGTTSGLSVYNPHTCSFTRYDQNNTALESDVIFSISEDHSGNIWIGTLGGGLAKLNPQTGKIVIYTTSNGLPDNTINAIVEDEKGSLWLSTNNGISHFDLVRERFKNSTLQNGIQSFEFSQGAGLKTSTGEILMGGVNGFNVIRRDHLIENRNIPEAVITGFKLFNKPVVIGATGSPLQQDITQTRAITLSYRQSVITFEFAALGFTASEMNQYAFMLEGFDKKWNYVGDQRTATYTNLDPGTYTFSVKCSNNDGIWNETGTSIQLTVTPPFWLTWWFIAVMVLIGIGGIIGFYKFRVHAIKKQRHLLELTVGEQTLQLLHSNKEERKARLEAELARAESEMAKHDAWHINEQLQIKNKELEQFAYVASHDLQEPLSTTAGFAHLLQQQYAGKIDERADKYLAFISDASARMKVFIKDLLDFSRIGSKAELKTIDCNWLVEVLLQDIKVTIEEAKANIRVTHLPVIKGNPTEVRQLFQNLLFNALKFHKKDIAPVISISAQKKCGTWQFAVTDNGIGIEEQYSERIFIIFQRLHTRREYTGSGIGLSHCKKIVELHRGKIWVESIPGKGSTFYFSLPADSTATELPPDGQRMQVSKGNN